MDLSTVDWTWVGIAIALTIVVLTRVSTSSSRQVALVPGVARQYKLIARTEVNHNTRIFRFALPTGFQELGLPIGKHIVISAEIKGLSVSKAYTPIGSGPGYFDLLIKVYFPNEKFPEGGRMSQYIDSMKVGESVAMKGPTGSLEYLGEGSFVLKGALRHFKKIGMIAGGTGITPMLQVAKAAKDLELSILFANQTPDDILLQDEIESCGFSSVAYTVDRPTDDWTGLVGFIDEAKIRATLPAPGDDVLILVCGPPAMIEYACRPAFQKIAYEYVHVF